MRRGVRLGVDVGSVRIGLAASDAEGILASPVATLERRPDGGEVREIAGEAVRREAIEVVVGLPTSLSGAEGSAAALARSYAQELYVELSGRPVRLFDERNTTVVAHRQLRSAGLDSRARRGRVDQVAAAVILQGALDAERRSGEPAGQLLGSRKPRSRRARAGHEGSR